jgi:glycosyltransferase involved in cell wall biosynthesis
MRGVWLRSILRLLLSGRALRANETLIHAHISHNGSFLREGSFVVLAKLLGLQTRVTVHGSAFVSSARSSALRRLLYSAVLKGTDRVAALNHESLETAKSLGARNVQILPNPGPVRSDLDYALPSSNGPIVVFAGSVGRRKGVDILLDAWEQVLQMIPDAQLEVYGPSTDLDVVARAGRMWKGAVQPNHVWAALDRCRVAVLPSTAEAMPMFVMEAQGRGRPMVVTKVGAMPDQVHGCGKVVGVGDPEALAEALLSYLTDPGLADAHGATAKSQYESRHGVPQLEERLLAFYAQPKNLTAGE